MNIDTRRIFATGFSNGAMMAYRIACELPDIFSAIAAVSGTDNTDTCSPSSPISILHIHAKDDQNVLFDGGTGPKGARDKSQVTDFTPVMETIDRWIGHNQCNPAPQRVLSKPGVVCDLYSPCQDNARVKLCVRDTGGHSWSGQDRRRSSKKNAPENILSTNNVIWNFFKDQE